jgi:hypothetical protein
MGAISYIKIAKEPWFDDYNLLGWGFILFTIFVLVSGLLNAATQEK